MLRVADFKRAIEAMSDLRYRDHSWHVWDNPTIVECKDTGESYIYAAKMLTEETETGTAYRANNVRRATPDNEICDAFWGYFLKKYKEDYQENRRFYRVQGSQREVVGRRMERFFVGLLRHAGEACMESDADTVDRSTISAWICKHYPGMDESVVSFFRESFGDVRSAREFAASIPRRVVEALTSGGFEEMRACIREMYKGIDAQDAQELEAILDRAEKNLVASRTVGEALDELVVIEEPLHEKLTPFTKRYMDKVLQDTLKEFGGKITKWMGEGRENTERPFFPLSTPRLFLDLARLGGKEEITHDDILGYVKQYGLLGFDNKGFHTNMGVLSFDGISESVSGFVEEAEMANHVKREYEAAIRLDSKDDHDVEAAMRELRELNGWSNPDLSAEDYKQEALNSVEMQIQVYIKNYCSWNYHRIEGGFIDLREWHAPIGAMYLQFAQVLVDQSNVRRCAYCDKLIGDAPEGEGGQEPGTKSKTRSDARFCPGCKNKYHSERRKKRGTKPSGSVSEAVKDEIHELAAAQGTNEEQLLAEMIRVYKQHVNQSGSSGSNVAAIEPKKH